MIRRTIEEHLDKELRLRPQGIKVLSLFFIDVVEHYRSYTADGAPGEGQVCGDVRGGIPQGRRQAEVSHALQRCGFGVRRHGSPRRLFLHRQEGNVDRHRREQPGQPRQRRARLQPDHEGQGETAGLRDEAEIHLLPLRAARGLGQPERLSDLRHPRDGHRARAPPDHRARPASLREPAGRTPARASRSTPSPSSPPRATSSSPRTSRRRSRRTPASASASWKSTSSPPSR